MTTNQIDQLTGAAYAALDAWNPPPPEPTPETDTSETPSDETPHAEPPQKKAQPAATLEETFDRRPDLDEAIGHAETAVAKLGTTRAAARQRSRADAADAAAVHDDRPAFWAEPQVDL